MVRHISGSLQIARHDLQTFSAAVRISIAPSRERIEAVISGGSSSQFRRREVVDIDGGEVEGGEGLGIAMRIRVLGIQGFELGIFKRFFTNPEKLHLLTRRFYQETKQNEKLLH